MSSRGNGQEKDLELVGSAAATEEVASETAPEPVTPEAQPAELAAPATADEVVELRREVEELKQTLLRRRADFENYRKRVERDRAAIAVEAEAALLKQLLGTVDNLERALAAQDAETGLREGVVLTHHELTSLLASLGVETIDPLGQRFDPAEHQAILHEPAPGFEAGTVAEVFRKGFRHRERLLRPALVKVASAGASPNPGGGGDVQ